ncbi:MAG: SurA N-terminal domain-containing protein [Candidatus Hydrogenedentota bacterium]|nr:MAG: SurA N-terminal domain-containing protein [Candidatus Hydrogenedentota bacterium]
MLGSLVAATISLALFSTNSFPRIIDGIAIIVNRDAILVSEINEAMMPLIQEYRSKYAGAELKQRVAELRKTIVDQAIDTKLILQVAREKGITADEKTVDARVEVVKSRFPSEAEFLEVLAARGITYREYRDQVAEQVLVQETIRLVLGADISVSDNEIQEYYESHPDEFITERKVKLAQIFLTIPSGSSPEEMERLRQKGEQLRILIEDGIEFSELAGKYSEGPYRGKGGVVGVVGPREILPELEEIAFGLKTGEVSLLIQTRYGLHILKALEAIPPRKITFDEAKPLIEERVREMKRGEKYKEWIKKLREDAFIDVKV